MRILRTKKRRQIYGKDTEKIFHEMMGLQQRDTKENSNGFFARMVMEHRDDAGVVVFTSRAWGRLFVLVRWSQEMIELEAVYSGLEITYRRGDRVPQFSRFATRRKNGAHISGGQFVARLAKHFGLLTAEILGGLTVISSELPIIDMAEPVRLQICIKVGDTWAWVAMGPDRQPDAAAGALRVAQDALAVNEGGQVDPTPAQAPSPQPVASRTMTQRLARFEEDVHEIRGTLAEQREVISVMAHDFSRFCTWTTTSLVRMMDRAGVTYTSYYETPREYTRHMRCRTGEASTSTAQQGTQQSDL
ncbi:hypothetical protein Tco_0944021 [Tanacetum coccineum]